MLTERDRDAVYAISRALLVGTQVFLAIEKWRAENSRSLARWLSVWGEFEALLALSGYAYEHPENTFPLFLDNEVIFEGREMGHPLLPTAVCVRNDVRLDSQTRFYVVSGSNMAGKSTLLRTIGLNAVLAYAGAPVPSKSLTLSLFSVCASLSIIDSLQDGKSKFFAEMERVRQTIDAAQQRPVLFLIDEILSGTNSRDRRVAAEAIVRTLVERGALGLLSTHDLALTEIADLAGFHGANVHMGSRNGADPLDFDFVLKPGITTESNALQIATLAGVVICPTSADKA
jgi:DNA mismatch repair ATPase MutS